MSNNGKGCHASQAAGFYAGVMRLFVRPFEVLICLEDFRLAFDSGFVASRSARRQ